MQRKIIQSIVSKIKQYSSIFKNQTTFNFLMKVWTYCYYESLKVCHFCKLRKLQRILSSIVIVWKLHRYLQLFSYCWLSWGWCWLSWGNFDFETLNLSVFNFVFCLLEDFPNQWTNCLANITLHTLTTWFSQKLINVVADSFIGSVFKLSDSS